MSYVKLSKKSAIALLSELDGGSGYDLLVSRARSELRAALAPKKRKAIAIFNSKARELTVERENRETAKLREQAMARAAGVCECGCKLSLVEGDLNGQPELDHFFGRKGKQSVRTVWVLRAQCHRLKTKNIPDAGHWLERFIGHCDVFGYGSEASRARARLEGIVAVRRAEAAGR